MRLAAAALAAVTLARLVMAAVLPLSPDEAYYWVWSHALAPGYPDHPPMVALWIWLGTALAGQEALGVRLLGPLSAALGSVLLADAAERLLPGRRAGITAAALLNATLLFGVGTVVMTPDTPLLFFWTGCLWALARIASGGGAGWWLVAGLAAGLALDSKYTAVFLPVGVALWLLAVPGLRRWWRHPAVWAGAALGGAAFLPVVWWNATHGWASLLRQGGRVGDWQPERAPQFLAELLGGQIGLATPLVFLLCAGGVAWAVRRTWRERDPSASLLAALTVPAVLVFVQHALGGRVQGNWPAIVYPAAATAGVAVWPRLHRPAVALGAAITLAVYVQATLAPLPLPARLDPSALRLAGWDGLAKRVEAAREAAGASFIVAEEYSLASELAWRLPAGVTVVGAEPRWALFTLPPARLAGAVGILVRSARRGDDAGGGPWSDIAAIGPAERSRGGAAIEGYRLYRVVAARDTDAPPRVLLPRP